MTREVGLLFVLLDEMLVRSRVDLPVQRRQVVTRQVLAVLGELDAEALVGAAVQPAEKPLDDRARLEIDGAEPRDDRGVEIARWTSHYKPLAGNGTASSRDRKSTRLNSSHSQISYAVFCL